MLSPTALVITSIAQPSAILKAFSTGCQAYGLDFIVIGDVSSPDDFQLDGCNFWGIQKQRELPFHLAQTLPEKHYARKNLGYLIAMQQGVETIMETDDDNLPFDSFWQERRIIQSVKVIEEQGWVNVYRYFSDERIWPRGYPLELVQASSRLLEGDSLMAYCPIQQGLADGNPDVDAVYRLTMPLPISFRNDPPIAIGKGCWSPFNSQNTTWFKPSFPLLYIPSFCSFRMCDIWRSFIATRICWENGWNVMFHGPTVFQERNEHDLLRDFQEEIPGYLNNRHLCQELAALELRGGHDRLGDDLRSCYELLVELNYVGPEEIPLVDAWLKDVALLL